MKINPDLPDAPDHLTEAAREEWNRILPHLELKRIDRTAIAMYCAAYGRWADAEKRIAEDGAVVKLPHGHPIPNPFLAIANKAMSQMTRLLGEFGLSPAAREKLRTKKPAPPRPRYPRAADEEVA